uniref:Uncharacterized protein n=1 Tax=Nelumbo nucifera TaxID=4432 RepID=A0A822XVV8_NELNU|nr:TPA_asm: hypothetical protein HUJ06_025585 [Nelumbo nucifera]
MLEPSCVLKIRRKGRGAAFWEVHVEISFVFEEPLMRPYGCYRTTGDAVGSSVA